MSPRCFLPLLLALPLAFTAFAEEKAADETFIEPDKAGPDFTVQGEYTGEKCGAQVVALGGGQFHIVGWSKGLPGTTDEAVKKIEVDAQRAGDKVTFDGNGWKGKIEAGQLTGTNDEGRTLELSHTVRESPTLGVKPPAGATVLFDGTNADAWEGGHVDERKLLGGGTKSKQKFGDFTLHVEFRTPFKPAARGQGRGNSGVYLQDRYEVQVLDSFGLNGENNECGGIYSKIKPRLNACFPPLSWQTYDIDFESARFDAEGKKTKNAIATIRHNGILIHDHVEIPGPTGGGQPEKAEPGPIQLQGHGNPVFFRNIWIVEKK
ncbi:MAG TPA: DUF1080 domain-containing protein [Chthoniobacter sp.]|nr:DUF1080 domain-containing protein [Chthoniobacter sp.]